MIPKIIHTFWFGKMPILNYISALSIHKFHPDFEIKIYTSNLFTKKIEWKSGEQSLEIEDEKDYLEKIKETPIKIVDISETIKQFRLEKFHPVIISDYLRIYFLLKYGGIYSDLDIIYTKTMEINKFNGYESVIFKSIKDGYFPFGLFIAKKNSNFFRVLNYYQSMLLNSIDYQRIGTNLLNKLIYTKKIPLNNVLIVDCSFYLPVEADYLEQLFKNKIIIMPESCVGVHWFNGSLIARDYINQFNKGIINDCIITKLIEPYLEDILPLEKTSTIILHNEKLCDEFH